MTINQIVRNTVERLKAEGKVWTPDVYTETFCAEAKKAGFAVEDCSGIDRYNSLFDKKTAEEIKQYRVKTTAELIRFLISKLSRMNPNEATILVELLSALAKKMAQSIDVLHNPDASALAKKTITILESQGGSTQIELLKQAWSNFLSVYDDSFLMKLAHFGSVDSANLRSTIENLSLHKSVEEGVDYNKTIRLLISSLVPSIAPTMDNATIELSQKLNDNPAYIATDECEKELKTAIAMRIALDKRSVEEMVNALDKLLEKLSAQLIDLIERSESSSSEIREVKRDLEALESNKPTDFKTAHKRLYTIASTLEEKVEVLSKDLKVHNEKVTKMGKKIAALEAELAQATQASREDFLTKLFNKRAIEEYMSLKEAEFERHGHSFCIAMLDLDHFKAVNDTYGHEAGDAVLIAFAKILKDEARTSDIVGRFGGEEFLAILGDTDLAGAKIFCEKVRAHVEQAHFMYQGQRIAVSVSIGVAERSDYSSLKGVVKGADEHLYDAKRKGRNRVEPA
ncbi:MAG: diguanylate cyclase [Sulfuricurvum sp. GWF2_44_89]|uniref:diguanylate cyclase n=1 Tax=Sulfuricurvum kujiense TaxID=148813 RepID=A0A2D3WHL0_9BACT|nr:MULTISPECIES: GGDEF domain-containing protein [Sulfuricurvum]OHD78715.1 MAG: diguanylate cyclase [Sulfuricurvum sp. GWF2_44_89]OHD90399.1 MAG: diguanylate cyclase [Sulfuricurvum sp. RIFOXYD12_FULL_44_77]OHD99422.1 MAG: diguanylate cyclase [Sulfuricurvum sp. RIFOXYD2_FULL_44_160]DAB39385.1 MAG TPA: GGDEF domain-containing protein [Sulfuricurvum kujiense]